MRYFYISFVHSQGFGDCFHEGESYPSIESLKLDISENKSGIDVHMLNSLSILNIIELKDRLDYDSARGVDNEEDMS
jgi:hypothetical protein